MRFKTFCKQMSALALAGSVSLLGCDDSAVSAASDELVNPSKARGSLPANEMIFADMNNNGRFDTGVDKPLTGILNSSVPGQPAGFFSTFLAKGAYTPPSDRTKKVGIVVLANADGSRGRLLSANGTYFLLANGNVTFYSDLSAPNEQSGYVSVMSTAGKVNVTTGVSLNAGSGVDVTGLGGVRLYDGASLDGGIASAEVESDASIIFYDNVHIQGTETVRVTGKNVNLGTNALLEGGPGECVACTGDGSVRVSAERSLKAIGLSANVTPVDYFNPEEDEWLIQMVSLRGGISIQDSTFNGYSEFSAAEGIKLIGCTMSEDYKVNAHLN